ncbi:MAG: polysaccharide biosynthesis protein [Flavobacteriaceae bacterium]|nr:polysaccharide biosynthesis protein [Flavobacteriaceae bacterium]
MMKKLSVSEINKLLDKESALVKSKEIEQLHRQKYILVTGGAGSIGSELVRQICLFSPKKIVVLDQGETPLHQLSLNLSNDFPNVEIDYILSDVSDPNRLEQIFQQYRFDIVYHAAAYKHVPIIEKNPYEGVKVNILGTKILAEFSSQYEVEKFVLISTDKAVNPVSVMGATKRVAELIIQYFQRKNGNKTKFITTRFGNVLGSNGSVVFRFMEQVENRQPITITHPEITRYFMSISESCRLVLQSVAIGKGGEICVFDMGEPIKIVDLAKKIGQAYGVEIGKDIDLIFTGLRDGDKIEEELFNASEKVDFTQDKIMFSNSLNLNFEKIKFIIEEFQRKFHEEKNTDWKNYLKTILKDFN